MKSLVSKLFFGAAIIMMSSMISCKDKDREADADMDVDNEEMIDRTETVDPTPVDTTMTEGTNGTEMNP